MFTPTRLINFDNNFTTTIYPNPAIRGQRVTIKNENISKDRMISISISNMAGQVVWQKGMTAVTDGMILLDIPAIPAAAYLLQFETDQYTGKAKIVVDNR